MNNKHNSHWYLAMKSGTLIVSKFSVCLGLLVLAVGPLAHGQETTASETPAVESLADAAARSPAVATVLDMPREKPADALEAVLLLLNLGEIDAATELFKPLAAEKLTAEQLAEMVARVGTAEMLKLQGTAGQQQIPGARLFAQKALDAAEKLASDPKNLQKLIADLNSPSAETRQIARHELAVIGTPAAVATLEALAQETDPAKRAQLMLAVTEMRPTANRLVVTALAEGAGQFRRDAAELAGHLKLREAIPWLATLAAGGDVDPTVVSAAQGALQKMDLSLPNQGDALVVVRRELERLDAGIPASSEEAVADSWWSFDPATGKFTRREFGTGVLCALAHSRLAQNFLHLPTATPEDRQYAILAALQAAHLTNSEPSEEISQLAKSLPLADLNSALAKALETNRAAAAIVCLQVMRDRGDQAALVSFDGLPAPLVRAVNFPNRDVQFAGARDDHEIASRTEFCRVERCAGGVVAICDRRGFRRRWWQPRPQRPPKTGPVACGLRATTPRPCSRGRN